MAEFLSRLARGLGRGVEILGTLGTADLFRERALNEQRQLGNIMSGQSIPEFARAGGVEPDSPENIRKAQLAQLANLATPESLAILGKLSSFGMTDLEKQQAQANLAETQAKAKYYAQGGGVTQGGGAIGQLADRIKAAYAEKGTPIDDASAIYMAQTGLRQGQMLQDGNIVPIPGAPETKTTFKEAEKIGELNATARTELKKKGIQADNVLGLIKEAEVLLPSSSSGLVATGVTAGSKLTGKSTAASRADAKLKVIGASLVSNVPRMEGPQSNYDVQLYREAASDVANTMIPYEDRLAALETMKVLNQKYINEQIPTGGTVLPKVVNFNDLPR